MFLKTPRASTDQRVRSLLQKAARRGYVKVVELALARLDASGDKAWLRSRAIVITFEECWPLAASLSIGRELSSKRDALNKVARAAKQKDAAGLGALAYAYREGDQSTLACAPDPPLLKIVSEALSRPDVFFRSIQGQAKSDEASAIVWSAENYLPAATWEWDKACILAGALLAAAGSIPATMPSDPLSGPFPYWTALDKHTPEGKDALSEVAKRLGSSYRQLIWASFYCESARVNQLLPSPWWEAERTWRLGRAGLSLSTAQELWSRARPLVQQSLQEGSESLKKFVESTAETNRPPTQIKLV